jgi:hypothetical protein
MTIQRGVMRAGTHRTAVGQTTGRKVTMAKRRRLAVIIVENRKAGVV